MRHDITRNYCNLIITLKWSLLLILFSDKVMEDLNKIIERIVYINSSDKNLCLYGITVTCMNGEKDMFIFLIIFFMKVYEGCRNV